MTETAAVTRASLGTLVPVIAPVPMTLRPARVWSQEQWERIKRGYRARGMVVAGEPAAGLRAELVRLSSPPGRPALPEGVIEHSILGLRSFP